jgi:hypothetical protein
MMLGVQVFGDEVVCTRLGRGSAALCSGENLERLLVVGALLPLNDAKTGCPKKTGHLARSLHIGGHTADSGGLSEGAGDIGGNVAGAAMATILAGTNVEYAPYVEYGHHTRGYGIDKTGSDRAAGMDMTHWVPAQPYMRPAFDGSGPVIAAEMGRGAMMLLKAAM